MTDQNIPDVTDDDRRRAREWAESIESATNSVESTTNPWSDRALAAARVILDTVPAPQRPTLADMTDDERAACQWMQADVEGQEPSAVITYPDRGRELVKLIDRWGKMIYAGSNLVTPRPDLPRLEWPGDRVAEDLAPAKAGTVIDSADDPRLAALPIDSILLDRDGDAVTKERKTWTGSGYIPIPREGDEFGPWKVIYIGREAADATD